MGHQHPFRRRLLALTPRIHATVCAQRLGVVMPPPRADLPPGTLDVLILKAVSRGPLHGYAVLLRIEQITGGALLGEQGALYPALCRLEHRGLLESECGVSDNNRRAKYYRLTAAGRRQLRAERESWNQLAAAMAALSGEPDLRQLEPLQRRLKGLRGADREAALVRQSDCR
jgi:PadR family transcriptional regulator, regulatory protein PadR